ncbi:hypothetical protein HDU93_002167 [Gonapodya sp. JEL0774]|nr:hypothetical protein HDU93_002167 [Gonapodya sp. JEL0774]
MSHAKVQPRVVPAQEVSNLEPMVRCIPGLSLIGVETAKSEGLTTEERKVARARARTSAEASYRGIVKISGYLLPVLAATKWFVVSQELDRSDVDRSWFPVKNATRYHFAVAGPLILLQNLIVRDSEITRSVEPYRWAIDTLLLVGALAQTYSKYYLSNGRP